MKTITLQNEPMAVVPMELEQTAKHLATASTVLRNRVFELLHEIEEVVGRYEDMHPAEIAFHADVRETATKLANLLGRVPTSTCPATDYTANMEGRA